MLKFNVPSLASMMYAMRKHKLHVLSDCLLTVSVAVVSYAYYKDMMTTVEFVASLLVWLALEATNILVYTQITRPLEVLQSFMNRIMMEKRECNCCVCEVVEDSDEDSDDEGTEK